MSALPLTRNYPAQYERLELVINRQPKSHHRARYQKEGSRGSIKNVTGESCPAVQLKGTAHLGPQGSTSILQVYIAAETGDLCSHPSYRIHPVRGKNSTPCRERQIDNVPILEMDIRPWPEHDGVVNLDCIGIMKLRNADLETDADLKKGRGPRREPLVRLVFRSITSVRKPQGFKRTIVLQVSSLPICCASSAGVPEITMMSHTYWPVMGGADVVILGRNFLKDETKLFVQETTGKYDENVLWQCEVPIHRENFQAVHLVTLSIPYRDLLIRCPVRVQLIIRQKGKASEPFRFLYVPPFQLSFPTHEPIGYLEHSLHSRPRSMLLNDLLAAHEFPQYHPSRAYSGNDRNGFTPSETIVGRNSLQPAMAPTRSSASTRSTSPDSPDAYSTPDKHPGGVIRHFSDVTDVEHSQSPSPGSLTDQTSREQLEQDYNVSSVSDSFTSSFDNYLQIDEAPPSPTYTSSGELFEMLLADIMA